MQELQERQQRGQERLSVLLDCDILASGVSTCSLSQEQQPAAATVSKKRAMTTATAVATAPAPAAVPLPQPPEATVTRGLRRSADQLASLCQQLSKCPKDSQLLGSLLQAASEVPEPLRRQLMPVLEQLRRLRLDTSAFVLMAVVGQELLASGCATEAVVALEAALRVGSCSLKLRGSVLSALSRAHWAVGRYEEGLNCMQQDLDIAKELGN